MNFNLSAIKRSLVSNYAFVLKPMPDLHWLDENSTHSNNKDKGKHLEETWMNLEEV